MSRGYSPERWKTRLDPRQDLPDRIDLIIRVLVASYAIIRARSGDTAVVMSLRRDASTNISIVRLALSSMALVL